jgi:transcriptional regulator with XRE-family HTH domain
MPRSAIELTPAEVAFLVSLGERIRDARERVYMSQRYLAKEVGVSRGVIAHIEAARSEPAVITLQRIARVLGIEIVLD